MTVPRKNIKYRGRNQIFRDMLEACVNPAGIQKTRIMYATYMSCAQMRVYLGQAIEKGLVIESDGLFFITQKGVDALHLLRRVDEIIGDNGIAPVNTESMYGFDSPKRQNVTT
jgi:predicted transcriptional regulator